MLKLCLSLVVAWILVLLMGPKVIPMLRKLHFGQTIYDLGPQAHKSKQGTPVMGGLMMAAAMVVVTLLLHAGSFQGKSDFGLALLAVSLLSMLVGFTDDYIKAVKKRHEGLTPWQKIAGQVVVAVLFSYYCYRHPQVGSSIILPISGNEWDLGWVYVPLMSLLAIFMINSANLQDGLDGLMGSVTSVSMIGWGALCLVMYRLMPDAAAAQNHLTAAGYALGLAGAAMGYLRYNRYPAKVFMGDTGSMFIGGAVVGLSMLTRQPFLLLLFDFTLIMSSVSVILQRIYFKLTHGKRIFKMSPIHHHFELSGYSETQIVSMYACVTAVLSVCAVLSQIR